MKEIEITHHARDRICERLKIPKRAALRNARVAYRDGLTKHNTRCDLSKYMARREAVEKGPQVIIKAYRDTLYYFAKNILITVTPIPSHLTNL